MTEDIERALRDSLARHAQQAPNGIALAEQIIATTRPSLVGVPRARQWRAWTLPLIAAGSVAAIALTVFGVGQLHHDASPRPAAPLSSPIRRPSPSPTNAPTTSSTATPTPSPSSTASTPTAAVAANGVGLANFKVVDMTFTSGGTDAWAIGTADCTTGPGTCAAMVDSTDGGATWHSLPQPGGAGVKAQYCSGACISSVRFANSKDGYAYSPSAFYMTTDGGQKWTHETGGAYALEIANGNVVRVVSPMGPSCYPGCTFAVETSVVGSGSWHSVALPGGGQAGMSTGLTLIRQGNGDVSLLVYANPAGGASTEYSTLFLSSNAGASWTKHAGDPCPQVNGAEDDSTAIAAGGTALAVLCSPRGTGGSSFVAVSPDYGQTFHAGNVNALGTKADNAIGVATPSAIMVFGPDSQRSTDEGKTWHPIGNAALDSGSITFVGFETLAAGRVVVNGGRTILTTTNAGLTWTAYTFPEN